MRPLLLLCTSLALVLGACVPVVPPNPPKPVEPPQAEESCEAFCDLYVRLGCEDTGDSPGADEVQGNADDVECVRVCRDVLAGGGYTPDRGCLDTAQTCEAAEECVYGPADGSAMAPAGSGPAQGPLWGPESPARRHTPQLASAGLRGPLEGV